MNYLDENELTDLVALRHRLHAAAELSLAENETMQILKSYLADHAPSFRIVEREGWFYAVKECAEGELPPIAFRADMDALPIEETIPLPYASRRAGVSHKCGHDGHCAALCGTAAAFEHLPLKRTVYLIFQMAEEIGMGGEVCASLIPESGICEVFAFHNLSGYPEGSLVYRRGLTQPASQGFTVRFAGKTSHASAPEEGRNPAEAVARLILEAGEAAREKHEGMVLCTVTGVSVGTGDFGISPGDGALYLTLRAEIESEMYALERRIREAAVREAETAGLTVSFTASDVFPETRNSDEGLSRVLAAAARCQMPVMEMQTLWRASEDFGHYLKQCPGAMVYLGNGETWPALHTTSYDFNDKILPAAVKLFSTLAE